MRTAVIWTVAAIAATLTFLVSPYLAHAHVPGAAKHREGKALLAYQERAYGHAKYVCARGSGAPKAWHCVAVRWIGREVAATRARLVPASPVAAITAVFGPYAGQAISVASCESGLSPYAVNGQYLGLFQMGSYARSRYGHSASAYGQARAAYAYFRDSGYGWAPWSCKP